jgi:hypothetical protein
MIKARDKVRGTKAGRFVVVEVMDFHGVPSARVREDADKARGTIVLPLTAIVPIVEAA